MRTSDHNATDTEKTASKRDLLLQSIKRGASAGPAIARRLDNEPAPLSAAQERLYFLDQLHPGSTAYSIPHAFQLKGDLNVESLNETFNDIIARHEILRTVVGKSADSPCQLVFPSLQFEMPVIDLEGTSGASSMNAVNAIAASEVARPFNLERLPLFRASLLRFSKEHYVLLLVAHHIIWDAWSSALFLSELIEGYRARYEQRSPHYPDLPVQYSDFAGWQASWLLSKEASEQLKYWEMQLKQSPTHLLLPFDKSEPAVPSYEGADVPLHIPLKTAEALRTLCREEHVTSFAVFAAVIGVWLQRYSDSDKIYIGCPVASRRFLELERSIGLFVNTVVLGIDLSGNPRFRDLVCRVRQTTRDALAHQDVPFEKVVQTLRPERNKDRNPLFQVMFMFSNAGMPEKLELQIPGLTLSELPLPQTTSKFDLYVRLGATGLNFGGGLEYCTDRFSSEAGATMAGHLMQLLTGLIEAPDQPISLAPSVTRPEYDAIIHDKNDTQTDFPVQHLVHALIEARTSKVSYAPACIFGGATLTYQALDQRANAIAGRLRALGVGPDVVVGIAAHRSLEMAIGLLGVLKSGGAYLPLDPEYPSERLQFMIEDCRVPVILIQKELMGTFAQFNTRCMALEDEASNAVESEPMNAVQPDNLAYVIYTSGSTGLPKACMNTHRGLCNRLLWMQEAYGLTSEDRVLQKTPYSFDVSVWEYFWPLMNGATIVLARPHGHRDTAYLAEVMRDQQITTVHFVPSMLEAFLNTPGAEQCKNLKRVISSGEPLSRGLEKRFFSVFPNAELHNLYGPTEAAIDVTAWPCRPDNLAQTVPIGYPIANLQTYVLDREMRPLPVAVRGELYIGGTGVGRGYWGRPDLTAERFLPDPFSPIPGGRLYLTGDLARWSPQGPLEFFGRIDRQVKINGCRIELGEVESCLRQNEQVRDAVVTAINSYTGPSQLVAYVIPQPDTEASILRSELRTWLKSKLPDYMLPASFSFLPAFPLTSSGKLDWKSLPAPDRDQRSTPTPYEAPRTATQKLLCNIWERQLGIVPVGIHDNFFELGGDSIRSLRIVAAAERANLRLTVQQIFTCQTVAELSEEMETMAGVLAQTPVDVLDNHTQRSAAATRYRYSPSDFPLAELECDLLNQLLEQTSDVEDVFPLASLQDDLFAQHIAGSDPALGMVQKINRMSGRLDVTAYDQAFQMLAQRHQVARTSFLWKGLPRPVQVIHSRTNLPVTYEDWRGMPSSTQDQRLDELLANDAKRGLELDIPTPIRTKFVQVGDDAHLMLMSFNYMCLEGWSLSLLQQEQRAIMTALQNGDAIPEMPRPSYREYMRWLLSQDFKKAESFWTRELNACVLPTPLVGQLGVGVPGSRRFEREDVLLSGRLTEALRSLARSSRRTENSIYQGAWALLVSRIAELEDVVLGIAVTGRSSPFPGIQSLAGYAMNYIPLHLHIERSESFASWLGHVQHQQSAVLEYEHTPLKRLRIWCGLAADRLVFESIFYFQNADAPTFGELVGRFYARTAYPLRVDVIPQTADIGTQVFASYHERYFDVETIRRLLQAYCRVLEGIAENPSQSLDSLLNLSLLS